MLDDNLRVLSRRVHDLELETTERKEKVSQLEKEKRETSEKLVSIYSEQDLIRAEIEEEFRIKVEQKEKELRKLREEVQNNDNKWK